MLLKEYNICMPLTVEEYHIGQLYMIAKHSHEESEAGDGVEVVHNVPHNDPTHGQGQYTEKKIYVASRLPYWLQSITPRIFYVTEKSWNYYPYTETEYNCSFIPKLSVSIKTKYENNSGTTENCLELSPEELASRIVDKIDIAYDEIPPRKYKENEDPKFFKSKTTNRGPLKEGWTTNHNPIMCCYKMVKVSFEVWGLQTNVEEFVHKSIRDILLLAHRQAFTWIDEWFGMSVEDVRDYEKRMQEETNLKVLAPGQEDQSATKEEKAKEAKEGDEEEEEEEEKDAFSSAKASPIKETAPSLVPGPSNNPVAAAASGFRSWLPNWSSSS